MYAKSPRFKLSIVARKNGRILGSPTQTQLFKTVSLSRPEHTTSGSSVLIHQILSTENEQRHHTSRFGYFFSFSFFLGGEGEGRVLVFIFLFKTGFLCVTALPVLELTL